MSIVTLAAGAFVGSLLTLTLLATGLPLRAYGQSKDITKVPGTEGVRIMNVDPGSVFDAMKVEEGDTLLEIDAHRVKRVQEIEEIFRDIEPGRKVKFKVQHEGKVEEREMEYQAPKKAPVKKK